MPPLYHFKSQDFIQSLILRSNKTTSFHSSSSSSSHTIVIPSHIVQYLKNFQLDGLRFLFKNFDENKSCILNDETGLGKCVTVSVFLGAMLSTKNEILFPTKKRCLIIVSNDENIIAGWKFHLDVLAALPVKDIVKCSDLVECNCIGIVKWNILKSLNNIGEVNFDYVIIDNRGEMLLNKFCSAILLKLYENKANILISSVDISSDVKQLHSILRLCGRLESRYINFKVFQDKFNLPNLKETGKKSLEEYFLKREKLINYCRDFRLRRYRHQYEHILPFVSDEVYKKNLILWQSSIENNYESSLSSKSMSPLLVESESNTETEFILQNTVKEATEENLKSSRQNTVPLIKEKSVEKFNLVVAKIKKRKEHPKKTDIVHKYKKSRGCPKKIEVGVDNNMNLCKMNKNNKVRIKKDDSYRRITRAMQRKTRSTQFNSKYTKSDTCFNNNLNSKSRKRKIAKKSLANRRKESKNNQSIESMQFGQKLILSSESCDSIFVLPPKTVTPVPAFTNITDFENFNNTDLIVKSQIPNRDIIIVSSSNEDDDVLRSQSSIGRRTRNKRKQMHKNQVSRTKSPDLFSVCSESLISCSQNKKNPFDGFKIFDSEVNFPQQNIKRLSPAHTINPSHSHRSCLNILERIFEPCRGNDYKREQQTKQSLNNKILEEDLILESTSRTTRESPIEPPIKSKCNKVTNYLIGSSTSLSFEPQNIFHIPKIQELSEPLFDNSQSIATQEIPPAQAVRKFSQTTLLVEDIASSSSVTLAKQILEDLPQSNFLRHSARTRRQLNLSRRT